MNYFCFPVTLLLINYSSQLVPTEVVETDKGLIQGKILQTVAKNTPFSSFEGVPYAKPPIGYLRFKPPEELDEWEGVLNTTSESNNCPQWNYENNYYYGDEDCLYLNVYTPKINSTDKKSRAVMAYIYGGAFVIGYVNKTRYGPDFLLDEDVVIVAMNYRLGALGFLSLDHPNATGNAGLKDQSFALQWIQRNIDKFGGDPKRVTIFGQSAGAACVGFHVLSPLSKGLFHGAISMSGAPLNPWALYLPEEAISRGFYLGQLLGIVTTDKATLLKKLYSVSSKDIVLATKNIIQVFLPFNPIVESTRVSKNPFLEECSIKKYTSGNYNHVPQIIGLLDLESLTFLDNMSPPIFFPVIIQTIDQINRLPAMKNISNFELLNDVLRAGPTGLSTLTLDSIYKVLDITSDIIYNDGIDRTQKYLVNNNGEPIYYYRNSFDYPQAIHKVEGNPLNGTAHSDDVAHIFWMSNKNQSLDPNSEIGKHRSKMVRMWTNFAKYGNPTPNKTDPILSGINWPASDSSGTCLEINHKYSVGKRPIRPELESIQLLIDSVRPMDNGCYNSFVPSQL